MATSSGDKTLEIRVITAESDIPQLCRVKTAAFRDGPLHAAMYPVEDEDIMQTFYEDRERIELSNPSQFLVAVVDTNREASTIVAYARWAIPLNLVKEQLAASGDSSMADRLDSVVMNLRNKGPSVPDGTNIPLHTAYVGGAIKMYNTHGDRERDYSKHIYSSAPPCQYVNIAFFSSSRFPYNSPERVG
jgi:hypothetical protein